MMSCRFEELEMTKINPLTSPLEDCRVLTSYIKDKYGFKAVKGLIESKYKYRFKSAEAKEVVREFYDRFVIKTKGVISGVEYVVVVV